MSSTNAVVIGGSIAGLAAARVLTRYFDCVTVIDRDHLTADHAPRHGAPQAQHLHVLLIRGRQILEELFPGVVADILARGGRMVEMASEVHWVTPAGPGIRYPSDLHILAVSRPLLESVVRAHVRRDERVMMLDGREMLGLRLDPTGTDVTGVRVRDVRSADAPEVVLKADFVVDASGRGSKMPQWLKEVGYPAPRDVVITAHLGYGSRLFRAPERADLPWTGVFVQAAPPEHPRFGVLVPIEGGRWQVSLGGGDRQHPPTDDAGFLAFARSLRDRALYDAIKDAEPVTPVAISRSTQNRLRRFESLRRFPERLAVLGDAACAFNPVYAQGMTAAALGAATLDQCLAARRRAHGLELRGVGKRFQRALARVNSTFWTLATGEDCRFRMTEGASAGLADRVMHRYMDRVVARTTRDAEVRETLLRAFHMIAPLNSLLAPWMLWRVLAGRLASPPRERRSPAYGDASRSGGMPSAAASSRSLS